MDPSRFVAAHRDVGTTTLRGVTDGLRRLAAAVAFGIVFLPATFSFNFGAPLGRLCTGWIVSGHRTRLAFAVAGAIALLACALGTATLRRWAGRPVGRWVGVARGAEHRLGGCPVARRAPRVPFSLESRSRLAGGRSGHLASALSER